ncbi:hypothetical protein ElyMa_000338000 [Elysia marginata]|uniref:Uncharacterized protein n=1 Tax=Elysia marginata TaxID=1093978 RepID=A0AAV4FBT0_9GAST|nr:hypothetical protein ElyMa_000338000 [Elysia marginata]
MEPLEEQKFTKKKKAVLLTLKHNTVVVVVEVGVGVVEVAVVVVVVVVVVLVVVVVVVVEVAVVFLCLNVKKTKELIIDFRHKRTTYTISLL